MKIVRIVREDFDNLENHDGLRETEIAIFADEYPSLARSIDYCLAQQTAGGFYRGWDGRVYPRFRIDESETTK